MEAVKVGDTFLTYAQNMNRNIMYNFGCAMHAAKQLPQSTSQRGSTNEKSAQRDANTACWLW